MWITKMKIVLMCLAVTGFVFFTGCEDEQEPDTSYGVCDFTYKGETYHFVNDNDWHDPAYYLSTEYGGSWSFEFGTRSDTNNIWITYDPDYIDNRDVSYVGIHTMDALQVYINGIKIGTTKNKGKITITKWESHRGEADAEYIQSICEGTFSGTIVESDGSEFPIEGTFKGTIDDVD